MKVSLSAIQAPLIDPVLVPPSASRTSQSTVIKYPFNIPRSHTDRSDLPISLDISFDLPPSKDFRETL